MTMEGIGIAAILLVLFMFPPLERYIEAKTEMMKRECVSAPTTGSKRKDHEK